MGRIGKMSFRDELNSIRPDMKMISEQEMYETILYETYEEMKIGLKKMQKQRYIKINGKSVHGTSLPKDNN